MSPTREQESQTTKESDVENLGLWDHPDIVDEGYTFMSAEPSASAGPLMSAKPSLSTVRSRRSRPFMTAKPSLSTARSKRSVSSLSASSSKSASSSLSAVPSLSAMSSPSGISDPNTETPGCCFWLDGCFSENGVMEDSYMNDDHQKLDIVSADEGMPFALECFSTSRSYVDPVLFSVSEKNQPQSMKPHFIPSTNNSTSSSLSQRHATFNKEHQSPLISKSVENQKRETDREGVSMVELDAIGLNSVLSGQQGFVDVEDKQTKNKPQHKPWRFCHIAETTYASCLARKDPEFDADSADSQLTFVTTSGKERKILQTLSNQSLDTQEEPLNRGAHAESASHHHSPVLQLEDVLKAEYRTEFLQKPSESVASIAFDYRKSINSCNNQSSSNTKINSISNPATIIQQIYEDSLSQTPTIQSARKPSQISENITSSILDESNLSISPLQQCERTLGEQKLLESDTTLANTTGDMEWNISEETLPPSNQLQASSIKFDDNQKFTMPPEQNSRGPSLPSSKYQSISKPMSSIHYGSTSSGSRSNTLSSYTEDNSDWGEDESNSSVQDICFSDFSAFNGGENFSQEQIEDETLRPVLSPIKQALIDQIMKEFWIIFSQENETLQNRAQTTSPVELTKNQNNNTDADSVGGGQSSENAVSNLFTPKNTGRRSTRGSLGRRGREDDDDQEQDDEEGRDPKRPRMLMSSPRNLNDSKKFACPYRKRDPRKYCVKYWRPCALTPQDTVARVKGHLYRHHRIFPCQRCKALFEDQDAVSLHLMQRNACERKDIEHSDGVTTEVFEKLRSKKKTQKDQTEADRWKDIYKLLFPNEMVPDPYFEEVQEDNMLSPDSRELADYENYCRRELPRRVRAALEEIVHSESQPIEEGIRNQLMDIIRDCQDRVFSSYRSSSTAAVASSIDMFSRNPISSNSYPIPSQESITTTESSFGHTANLFFQPTTPQSHLRSGLDVSDLQDNNTTKALEGSDLSDSGYNSNEPGVSSRIIASSSSASESSSLTSSEPHAAISGIVPADTQGIQDVDNGLDLNTVNDDFRSHDAGTLNQSWLDSIFQPEEENMWNPYMRDLGMEYSFPPDQPL